MCKSALAAEARAEVSAADKVRWLRTSLTEMGNGAYYISSIFPPTDYPIRNPFGPPAAYLQVNRDMQKRADRQNNDPRRIPPWATTIADRQRIANICFFTSCFSRNTWRATVDQSVIGSNIDGRPSPSRAHVVLTVGRYKYIGRFRNQAPAK